MKISILLIDDDKILLEELSELLELLSCKVTTANNGKEGLGLFMENSYDLIITDIEMPVMNGFDLVQEIRKYSSDVPILVFTGHTAIDYAIKAMKIGADDFLLKPLTKDNLEFHLEKAIERKKNEKLAREYMGELDIGTSFDGIISVNKKMLDIFEQIKMVANLDITVMVTGESGCGKELVARSIHKRSKRSRGPFIPINSGSLPRELVASELFGHIKGSFTGAYSNKVGKFEEAKGGTLFLDELLTMDENTQISLLRVLETGEFYKIGSNVAIMADVRIITATNADVEKAIIEDKFREDLYHRLNVFSIMIPPLRERIDDIEVLIKHFIKIFSIKLKLPEVSIARDVLDILKSYRWPGNVRELRNVIQRALILSSGKPISIEHLPESIKKQERKIFSTNINQLDINSSNSNEKVNKLSKPVNNHLFYNYDSSTKNDDYTQNTNMNDDSIIISLDLNMDEIEKKVIYAQLIKCFGNKKVVAERLGISRKALYSKIKKYEIPEIKKKSKP